MSSAVPILTRNLQPREYFNPGNKKHLAQVKYFISNSKWENGCPFHLEHPFLEIPAMVAQRFLVHNLK